MKRSRDMLSAAFAGAGLRDARRAQVMTDLDTQARALKVAVDELNGDPEPDDPADLVRRIRGARAEIRRLLWEAEGLGVQDPLVQRLRAAHPPRPAK